MLVIRPDAAHRVTVFGSTRNRAATSPGVSSRSLLPSTFHLLDRTGGIAPSLATNGCFLPRFRKNSLASQLSLWVICGTPVTNVSPLMLRGVTGGTDRHTRRRAWTLRLAVS